MNDTKTTAEAPRNSGLFVWLKLPLVALIALTLVACGSDDDQSDEVSSSSSGSATKEEVCSTVDDLRKDIDDMESSVEARDFDAASDALTQAEQAAATLRDQTRDASVSDETSQAAADLVQSVDGLETNLRQARQPGASAQGVIQEIEIELPAIVNSITSLRQSVGCS